jgi:thiol:disulfide interchange protein
MKSSLIVLGLSFFLLLGSCTATKNAKEEPQATTVKFQQGISLENLLTQSTKSKKVIFVDFYIEGCLPCKVMDETVFTEKIVFDYYNKNFINVKMDALSFDYFEVAKQYNVKEYPTMMYLDETGNVLKTITGSITATQLLAIGKEVTEGRVL